MKQPLPLLLPILLSISVSAQTDCEWQESLTVTNTWNTISGSYEAGGSAIYEVPLQLGVSYEFKTGCGNGATADHDTRIEMITPICTLFNSDDDGCEEGRSFLEVYSSIFDTPLLLRVKGQNGQGGTFTLAFRSLNGVPGICNECPAYDEWIHPAGAWQTAQASYDQDGCYTFMVSIDEGIHYTFKTGCGDGAYTDGGTLLELRNDWCNEVTGPANDCGDGGSLLSWTAAYDGSVRLTVRSPDGAAGNFTMAYKSIGGNGTMCTGCPSHDFYITPQNNWNTHSSGYAQDGCVIYRIAPTPGHDLHFKTGCGDGASADHDTRLELYDSNCELLVADDDGCEDGRSSLSWSVAAEGLLYLKVSGAGDSAGLYTLASRRTITPAPCTNCPEFDIGITPDETWQTETSSYGPLGCAMVKVDFAGGHTYVFQTTCGEGAASVPGTTLELFGEDCTLLATGSFACYTDGSRLYYSMVEDGTGYLKVSNYGESNGEFTLAYKDLGMAADECADAEPVQLDLYGTVTFAGSFTNTSPDTSPPPALEGMAMNWHAIEIVEWCYDLIIEQCIEGSDTEGINALYPSCGEGSALQPSASDTNSCYNGIWSWYNEIPPGVYWIPVPYDPQEPSGNYQVLVQANDCIVIDIIGRSEPMQTLEIAPNPAQESFRLKGMGRAISRVELYDAFGRPVRSWHATEATGGNYDIRGVASGMYTVNVVTSEGRQLAGRLMVE